MITSSASKIWGKGRASASRSSSRCLRRTGVSSAVSTGSVQADGPSPPASRRASIRTRSSAKWTARTRVRPGRIGWSVKAPGAGTVTLNVPLALRPPGSVAVTAIVEVPAPTAASVTPVPATCTVATSSAADEAA